jgi:hypothetical protein
MLNLPYNPAILLLGVYTKEIKMYVHMRTYTGIFIEALLTAIKK